MELHLDQVAQHLRGIKDKSPESYKLAVTNLIKSMLVKESEGTEAFLTRLLDALGDKETDIGALREEVAQLKAEKATTGVDELDSFNAALQQQIPNLKTKAQFDLTTTIFMAIQQYLNAAFGNDQENAAAMRKGLDQALDLAAQMGTVAETLKDIPEATTNKAFVDPPVNQEVAQKQLLSEVVKLETKELFNQWYRANKITLDGITDPELRNELYDTIRKHQRKFHD